jgi:hypothetical protein
MGNKKPTIEELEKILSGPERSIRINPDGSLGTAEKEPENSTDASSQVERIVSTKTGKLIALVDKNTGNTMNGDIWRLAMECKERLERQAQSMHMDIKQIEVDLRILTDTIARIEKRWESEEC